MKNKVTCQLVKSPYSSAFEKFYFVNGVHVAAHTSRKAYFCTVKNGTPSRIRDKTKTAHEWRWDNQGLIEILGSREACYSFQSENSVEPTDHKWGFAGGYFTLSDLKEFFNS